MDHSLYLQTYDILFILGVLNNPEIEVRYYRSRLKPNPKNFI